MPATLVERYTYGNFADFRASSAEADFYLGVPIRQHELIALAKSQILEQRRSAQEISASNIAGAGMILRELTLQTERLQSAVSIGAEAITTAIGELGDRISGELTEIRWELIQLGCIAEQMLEVLRHPRSTEAQELIRQGIRNLAHDKIGQAEDRFELALRLDNTDYQVLMNLSAVELRKGNARRAIALVQDALTLPENLDGRARADALWHLSRILYANYDFQAALRAAQESTTLFTQPRRILQVGIYTILAGNLSEGISGVLDAVRQDPPLFAVAASTPDLQAHRPDILSALSDLTTEALSDLRDALRRLQPTVQTVADFTQVPSHYLARFSGLFQSMSEAGGSASYSECREYLARVSLLQQVPSLLGQLDSAARELAQCQQVHLQAKEALELARGRIMNLPRHPGCLSLIVALTPSFLLTFFFQFIENARPHVRDLPYFFSFVDKIRIEGPALGLLIGGSFWVTLGVLLAAFNIHKTRCESLLESRVKTETEASAAVAGAVSRYRDVESSLNQCLDSATGR